MAFLKAYSYVPKNNTYFCVFFPEMVTWKTTGNGYKRNASFGVVVVVVVGKLSNCLSGQTRRKG